MNTLDRFYAFEQSPSPAVDPRQLLHEHDDLRHNYLDFYKRYAEDEQRTVEAHGSTPNGTVVLCTTEGATYTVASFDLTTQTEVEYTIASAHPIGELGTTEIILSLQSGDSPDTHLLLSSRGNAWKHGDTPSEQLADMRLTTLYVLEDT